MATKSDVRRWRNIPESTEDTLIDFQEWLREQNDVLETEENRIGDLVKRFLLEDQKSLQKIETIEREMLTQWTESCTGKRS